MAVAATTKKKNKAMAPAAQGEWFIMYGIPKVSGEMSKEFPNAAFTFNEGLMSLTSLGFISWFTITRWMVFLRKQ
ncbi:hypothetical protein ACQJBY_001807 [Aegilops geniculata]